ncbi:MAG: hypothetical protein MUE50_27870 [Pirellulaceae bacterium]|nr:hypothetical protein [Pirellulaceae bacterium]
MTGCCSWIVMAAFSSGSSTDQLCVTPSTIFHNGVLRLIARCAAGITLASFTCCGKSGSSSWM